MLGGDGAESRDGGTKARCKSKSKRQPSAAYSAQSAISVEGPIFDHVICIPWNGPPLLPEMRAARTREITQQVVDDVATVALVNLTLDHGTFQRVFGGDYARFRCEFLVLPGESAARAPHIPTDSLGRLYERKTEADVMEIRIRAGRAFFNAYRVHTNPVKARPVAGKRAREVGAAAEPPRELPPSLQESTQPEAEAENGARASPGPIEEVPIEGVPIEEVL